MTDFYDLDTILDDLFHGAAIAAYVEQAALEQTHPCPVATKRRAYCRYEQALAENNQNK